MGKQQEDSARILFRCLIIIVGILAILLISSCASPTYVPIETVRIEYRDRFNRDSIHIHDSIYIREKEDTVWITRWRTEYQDRLKVDSIFLCDSIQVPYPVERKLTHWEQIKMDVGGIALGGLSLFILGFIVWIVIKTRKA